MKKYFLLILLVLCLITGCGGAEITSESEIIDSITFKTEYEKFNNELYYLDIKKDNPFKYITSSNIDDILSGTNVIFVGSAKSNITRGVVSFILSNIEGLDIGPIYYFDLDENRPEYTISDYGLIKSSDESEIYIKFIDKFDDYLDFSFSYNDISYKTDIKYVDAPVIIFIKDGKIICYYDSFFKTNDGDFSEFNNDEIYLIKKDLYDLVEKYED